METNMEGLQKKKQKQTTKYRTVMWLNSTTSQYTP